MKKRKSTAFALMAGLTIQACAPPDYFEELNDSQRNQIEQSLVEVENIIPFVTELMSKSPVSLVDVHGNECDNHNEQAILNLNTIVDAGYDFLNDGRFYAYDPNNSSNTRSGGTNVQNLGKDIENDYIGIAYNNFEFEGEIAKLRNVIPHEIIHSLSFTKDRHSKEMEEVSSLKGVSRNEVLSKSIEENDPSHQFGEIIGRAYGILYSPVIDLHYSKHNALESYYEDPQSENIESWETPQFVYNGVAGTKLDENELRNFIRDRIFYNESDALKLTAHDYDLALKHWFSSEEWDDFLEDYEYHYKLVLDEIANEFEDSEIETLEEKENKISPLEVTKPFNRLMK